MMFLTWLVAWFVVPFVLALVFPDKRFPLVLSIICLLLIPAAVALLAGAGVVIILLFIERLAVASAGRFKIRYNVRFNRKCTNTPRN